MLERLEQQVKAVRASMQQAAIAAGRDPEQITLLAATKYASVEQINALPALGVHDIGENRVQALLEKWDALLRRVVHSLRELRERSIFPQGLWQALLPPHSRDVPNSELLQTAFPFR